MAAPRLKPVSPGELDSRATRRLLKTWQEADLVRRMDAVIIASRGAYSDRNEFIAEALQDRIEEEEQAFAQAGETAAPAATTPPAASTERLPRVVRPGETAEPVFGDWLDRDVPHRPYSGYNLDFNFGLHNRDYPTLFAADHLGRLTSDAGGPVRWEDFVASATARAWRFAEQLQQQDLNRPPGIKVAAGFPTNRNKRDAAEQRFRDYSLGVYGKKAQDGPLFVFKLVGVDDAYRATLTEPALKLLRNLRDAEVGVGPPFSSRAWSSFAAHLKVHAPKELALWLRVLRLLKDKPDRRSLLAQCSWWSPGEADTNAMSYVARGREWGLVEPTLQERRYRLTKLGLAEVSERREI